MRSEWLQTSACPDSPKRGSSHWKIFKPLDTVKRVVWVSLLVGQFDLTCYQPPRTLIAADTHLDLKFVGDEACASIRHTRICRFVPLSIGMTVGLAVLLCVLGSPVCPSCVLISFVITTSTCAVSRGEEPSENRRRPTIIRLRALRSRL